MAEILVRVKPKSSRQAVLGLKDGAWQIALTSPPENGKANRELLKMLAKKMGLAPSSLEIVSGRKSREKRVKIPGLSESDINLILARF